MRDVLRKFFELEAASGIVLLTAAVLALIIANSPFYDFYQSILSMEAGLFLGQGILSKSIYHWINDGLMALFFLLVGLEIKREIVAGELKGWGKASLPVVGAAGGVMLPALIYLSFNHGTPAASGWAIPSATDIAFSLGVLALLGTRVPTSLKIFLMAVAVIDDLIAVIIIALFYTDSLHITSLFHAAGTFVLLILMAHLGVRHLWAYLVVGVLLWAAVLQSGVHATIAGVLLGMVLPLHVQTASGASVADTLESKLHPWVAYAIMPVFAFANAGVPMGGMNSALLFDPLPFGIALGLFAGKQLGIFSACALMIRLKLAQLPSGADWKSLYGTCAVAGIGFTMSLFIGTLAFEDTGIQDYVRVGVLCGSITSALTGYAILCWALPRKVT